MIEVGKLYACEEYHLMLYPDQETAAARAQLQAVLTRAAEHPAATLANAASYWSNQLGKSISYTEKNIPLLVLNNEENFYEVLAGDKKGWIIFKDWLKIREIT